MTRENFINKLEETFNLDLNSSQEEEKAFTFIKNKFHLQDDEAKTYLDILIRENELPPSYEV